MGFLRRGNYAANTVQTVLNSLRYNIRANVESTQYAGKTPEESAALSQVFLRLAARDTLILEGKCYVGITSDPVRSLTAHGIDTFAENQFFCADIPKELAAECKAEIMALGGFEAVSDSANDRTETTYSMLYVYIYRIADGTEEHPDLTGLTPREALPIREIAVRLGMRDGTCQVRYYTEMNAAVCDAFLTELSALISDCRLAAMQIRHRARDILSAEFGEGCCIISHDSRTSQCGGYQSYRSGETARKKVQLYTGEYPEYMLCRDMNVLNTIVSYYLVKGKKPGKRQNIKWVNMKYPGWE
ncbi:MAG: hypothetical protein IK130_05515 [Oscillospiraceae bacterium]|nr:hypothetical protein [Oscillospiraceae bacterium]